MLFILYYIIFVIVNNVDSVSREMKMILVMDLNHIEILFFNRK